MIKKRPIVWIYFNLEDNYISFITVNRARHYTLTTHQTYNILNKLQRMYNEVDSDNEGITIWKRQ